MRLLILSLLSVLIACTSKQTFDDAICIENITVIDPMDGAKEGQTVVIKDGKIHKIAPSAELKLSPDNTIINGTGKFLMPGLWDAHVHFAYMEEIAPRMFDLFMLYGITSVRDTGGRLELVTDYKEQSLNNPAKAPRVKIAGPLLDGMPNVYDGSDPGHPPLSVGLKTVEDVNNKIDELNKEGVDLLKAYEMLTPEQFAAVMKKAQELGLKVTGHVPLSMDVISASNGGLNSMEHLRNVELSCASNAEELLEQRRKMLNNDKKMKGGTLRSSMHDAQREIAVTNFSQEKAKEVIETLAKNGTWQIPTLALNTLRVEQFMRQPWWSESIQYLPEATAAQWRGVADRITELEVPPFPRAYADWMFKMVKQMHDAGVVFMAGTDTPIGIQTPGVSLHNELAVLVKAGLTPLEAIRTATYNPALYFKMENELGSVKEGMWADLLILNSDPLENIENTKKIEAVIKQGEYYDAAALDEIKGRLR